MPTTVHLIEVTTVKKNIICVELRDGDITKPGFQPIASPPDTRAYGSWYNVGGLDVLIAGPLKDYYKYADIPAGYANYLDRDAAAVAGDWSVESSLGVLTVSAVHRKHLPYDNGEWQGEQGLTTAKVPQFRHLIYLVLSGDLVRGYDYTISFPAGVGLADHTFRFDDLRIRCRAINHNQTGCDGGEVSKFAYLSQWIPGYGTEGRVAFGDISNWHIVNRNGQIVWSAGTPPPLRVAATTTETDLMPGEHDTALTSTTTQPRLITDFTNTNPMVFTYTGVDLVNDTKIRIEGLWGVARNGVLSLVGGYDQVTSAEVTADESTDTFTRVGSANFDDISTGTPVQIIAYSALPTGLAAGTTYYAIKLSSTQIKLATSSANATAGTAINFTTNGSGRLFIYRAASFVSVVSSGAPINFLVKNVNNSGPKTFELQHVNGGSGRACRGQLFMADPTDDTLMSVTAMSFASMNPAGSPRTVVQLATTGTLPAGLSPATDYWVIKVSDTKIKLATSNANAVAGTAIDITDAGTGVHLITGYAYEAGGTVNQINETVNRAATNVYGLDFSAFTPPAPGLYKIYIEGYGVSAPFHLDPAMWHDIAGVFAAGDYHHRHGVACDGRFGYTRPRCFSSADQPIYDNLLPYEFSNEIGIHGLPGDDPLAGMTAVGKTTSPMHTRNGTGAVTISHFIPGHMDAGDHDSRIGSHSFPYYGYLDFYERFPAAAAATDWGMPKMVDLFPADSRYTGTGVLPECLQQAMFALHGYIDSKNANGFIRGGVNNSADSSLVPAWQFRSANGLGGGDQVSPNTIYVYGHGHLATLMLVPLVAKMAFCLRQFGGFATLAQYYEDLALEMWNAFELVYDGGTAWGSHSSGAVATARTTLYGDYRTACEGLSAGTFASRFTQVQTSCARRRIFTAACLYKMTGNIAYGNIVTAATYADAYSTSDLFSMWEYITAVHANADTAKQATYRTTIKSWATGNYYNAQYASNVGFKTLRRPNVALNFGFDGTDWNLGWPVIVALLVAEFETPGSGTTYRRLLEDAFAYLLGANMTGRSFVTGLGREQIVSMLHNDTQALGRAPPKGITIYGPQGRLFQSDKVFGNLSGQNWITANIKPGYTTDYEKEKELYPSRWCWPMHEHFFECPGAIEMAEYVFGGSIGPQQWVASILWALNGATQTRLSTKVPAGYRRAIAATG